MGAFADWMANKLQGRERLKAGEFDVPEDERDPLSLNSYWTPAEEANVANDGGWMDQVGAFASTPIVWGKAAWEGAKDIIPFTRESLTRVPETDEEVKRAGQRGMSAVGTVALLNAPTTTAGQMAGLAANSGRAGAASTFGFLDDMGRGGMGHNGGPAMDVVPGSRIASPDEINRVAAESAKGAYTYDGLRQAYNDLGITGGGPNPAAVRSLVPQPDDVRAAAIDLKLQDRAALNALSPEMRKAFLDGKLKTKDFMLPSQEVAAGQKAAFAPTKKEVTRAEKSLAKMKEAGNDPTIIGAFDTRPEVINQIPDVPQFQLPRAPAKETPRIAWAARGGAARLDDAARNAPLENFGWYNTQQTRSLFHDLYGRETGENLYNAWLDGLAGTSMVNPVQNNIRSASEYLGRIIRGEPLPEVLKVRDPMTGKNVQTLAGGPPPGYGAKSQVQHAARVKEFLENRVDPVDNPKPLSFRTNLGGNWAPRTVDTHDIRNMIGYDKTRWAKVGENASLLPGEYAQLERIGAKSAERFGEPQAANQARVWVGGGEKTGLKSVPVPIERAINERAWVTGQVMGIPPEEALRRAFRGEMSLLANSSRAGAPAIMANIEGLQAREWAPSRGSGHLSGVQDMSFGDKLAMSRRSPFMASDAVQSGPSFKGVGAYEGAGGLETNPMMATPYNALPEDVNAIGSYYAAMLGQDAVPTSWPGAVTGPNTTPARFVDVRTSDPLAVSQMESLGKKLPGGAYAVIDDTTRGDVRFLGGEDMSTADIMARMREERIPASVSGEGIGASNYPDMAGGWAQPPGSGQVTRQMLDAMDQATPATRGAFDNFEMRQRALAENMHNRALADRYGLTTRADLMRMREIYGKEGFEGLRAALARGDALPSNADVAGIAAFLTQHEEGAEP